MGRFLRTYHASLGGSLHGDLGVGVDSDTGVEDAVGDLIAELVGVTLADRLGGEVDELVIGLLSSSGLHLVLH